MTRGGATSFMRKHLGGSSFLLSQAPWALTKLQKLQQCHSSHHFFFALENIVTLHKRLFLLVCHNFILLKNKLVS